MDLTSKIAGPLAALGYSRARPATEPAPEPVAAATGAAAQSTDGGLAGLGEAFAHTLRHGEETARAALTGGADAHALVQALSASQLAVETAVTVRDKVVEAYQEILRMPV